MTKMAWAVLVVVMAAGCSGGSAAGGSGGSGGVQHDSGADGKVLSPDGQSGGQTGGNDSGATAGSEAGDPPPHGYMLPDLQGGTSFYVRLPPSFSPFIPLSGDEATREPPGFYETTSDHYFSYGLVWWLTGTPDLSTAALRNDLKDYYVGLCQSATSLVTLNDSMSPLPSSVAPPLLTARRAGTLTAEMCFGNAVPPATIEVSTYTCPDHLAIILLVSPQPAGSPVWTELRALRDAFTCN